jgi:hypothetical protein
MSAILMNWKSTAAASAVTLLAGWFELSPFSGPALVPQHSAPAPRDARPVGSTDIAQEASRLQDRVRDQLDYRDPTRNPFRFAPRPPTASVASRIATPPSVSPTAPAPAPFLYTLSGMAADPISGGIQRTAILTSGSEVFFVKEGDNVAAFTVTRVDDNGVDLTGADGVIVRLTLRP